MQRSCIAALIAHARMPVWNLHPAVYSALRLLMVSMVLVTSGCVPVMEPRTYLDFVAFDEQSNTATVEAEAVLPFGGGISDAVMFRVKAQLTDAHMMGLPAFTFVFPDGFRVSSRALTLRVLQ